jgi:hypothetical protein
MNDNSFSVSRIIRAAACLILDIAMLIIFIKVFSIFLLLAPAGSVLMLLVLLIGLAIVNVVIIAPGGFYKRISLAYSTAISFLLVLYAVTANVVSVLTWSSLLMIPGNIIWYIVWQLLILAAFILIIAVIAAFTKRSAQDISANQAEYTARSGIALQLSDMQATLGAREGDPAVAPVAAAFKALRERLGASTPFGRIQGNPAVADLEYRIIGNLSLLQNELRAGLTGENAARVQGIMEETRRMVINRETLNIK